MPSRCSCLREKTLLESEEGFPGGASSEGSTCQSRRQETQFSPWVEKIPWRRAWQPSPVFLIGESRGQKSQVGYSPQSCKASDTTEATEHTHTRRKWIRQVRSALKFGVSHIFCWHSEVQVVKHWTPPNPILHSLLMTK